MLETLANNNELRPPVAGAFNSWAAGAFDAAGNIIANDRAQAPQLEAQIIWDRDAPQGALEHLRAAYGGSIRQANSGIRLPYWHTTTKSELEDFLTGIAAHTRRHRPAIAVAFMWLHDKIGFWTALDLLTQIGYVPADEGDSP